LPKHCKDLENSLRGGSLSVIPSFLRFHYPRFGLAGAIVATVCILVSALAYHGHDGQSYSLFNHFISELGEYGVSRLAWLFNAGLVAGGLLFIPFSLGLGLTLPGWFSRLGSVAGLVAAISLASVGIFPMNNLQPHILAAMTYFRSGLFTVILFGLAIQLQPKGQVVLDKRVNLASLLAVICYSAFLFYMQIPTEQASSNLDLSWMVSRPVVWPLAILEWSIFFSTILWFTVMAFVGRSAKRIPE
jgi:hypothetical membrane protein